MSVELEILSPLLRCWKNSIAYGVSYFLYFKEYLVENDANRKLLQEEHLDFDPFKALVLTRGKQVQQLFSTVQQIGGDT